MKPDLVESDHRARPDRAAVASSPSVYGTPISPETAATMTQMMVDRVANGAAQ